MKEVKPEFANKKELKPEFVKMLENLSSLPGGEAVRGLVEALATTAPSVAVRLNARKCAVPEKVSDADRVAWCDRGLYLNPDERPRFTFDPAMHQGSYYVQDPSSMAIGLIVKRLCGGSDSPKVYIDACAAPGGKTTAAIDCLPEGSLVIANEYDRRRAEALCENIVKWGYPGVVVTCGDTSRLRRLGALADIVAVDAPCSGEGMMRKDDTAVSQWSEGLVRSCATLQREIIDNAWEALKPGGYMIYSTCTFNRMENEENVAYMTEQLGAEPVDTGLEEFGEVAGAIDSPYPAARFLPGRVRGEGLFVAVVRKPADAEASQPIRPLKIKPLKNEAIERWVKPGYVLTELKSGTVTALPEKWEGLMAAMAKELNALYAGCETATAKGRDYVPAQALALSGIMEPEAFARCETDYATAIAYLRGEAVALPEGTSRGIVLLTYGGRPLGFAKNLGNRANNLYPKGWVIRSGYAPESAPKIV